MVIVVKVELPEGATPPPYVSVSVGRGAVIHLPHSEAEDIHPGEWDPQGVVRVYKGEVSI